MNAIDLFLGYIGAQLALELLCDASEAAEEASQSMCPENLEPSSSLGALVSTVRTLRH